MFLATTAEQRHWKTDEEVLFLGEWCRLYSQKHIWSRLNHRVLPYHWNDRTKLHRDTLYLGLVYEKYLGQLAVRLNALHRKNYSKRYWRLLIGPWLTYIVPVFYDAFLSIQTARNSGLVTNTWLSDTSQGGYLPDDSETMLLWLRNDEGYRHYLYSWIIKELGDIPFEGNPQNSAHNNTRVKNNNLFLTRLKRQIKNLIGLCSRFPSNEVNRIFFANNYFPLIDYIKLQMSLGQTPIPFCVNIAVHGMPMNPSMREALHPLPADDAFQVLLSKIVLEQIPTVYLEGYSGMNEKARVAFPKFPKSILSGVEIYLNEGFKFWAADQIDRGVKLIGVQHGGGYGCSLCTWLEDHEKKVCDHFFSWGWSELDNPKVKPISSPKLSIEKNKVRPDPNGRILWVEISLAPRYLYVLYSGCLSSQVLDYINDQQRFADSVSVDVHELLILRPYPIDSGWDLNKRWVDMDPSLNIYRGSKPLARQLSECRLCVQTYNSTALLESLSANFPTIAFMNPDHWELRESAQPIFAELRRVGLLHDSPESAASKVNDIYKDPMHWWMSSEVQAAKDKFCLEFARTSDTWLQEWKRELLQINDH